MPCTFAQAPSLSRFRSRKLTICLLSQTVSSCVPPYRPGPNPLTLIDLPAGAARNFPESGSFSVDGSPSGGFSPFRTPWIAPASFCGVRPPSWLTSCDGIFLVRSVGMFSCEAGVLVVGTADGVNGCWPSAAAGSSLSVFASAVFVPVTTIASTAATTAATTSATGPPIVRTRRRRRLPPSPPVGGAGGGAGGGGGGGAAAAAPAPAAAPAAAAPGAIAA